jgi:hypothetical protein
MVRQAHHEWFDRLTTRASVGRQVSSSKGGVKGLKKKGRGTGIKVWEKAVREMPPKMEIATSSRLVGTSRNDNGV